MQTGKANEEINKNITKLNIQFDCYMLKDITSRYPFCNLGCFPSSAIAFDAKDKTRISSALQVIGINFTVIHE